MMSDYDHLLIRVFDKQEKKMLYHGNTIKYDDVSCTLLGMDNKHVIFDYGCAPDCLYKDIEGYIPMLCAAYKDYNNKLIYEHDIIKTSAETNNIYFDSVDEYVIERYKGSFIANGIGNYFLLDELLIDSENQDVKIKISGNIHENLNPLTKKEINYDK